MREAQATGAAAGIVGIINVFAGGALQQMAIFALGIMPYITASIIMQLLAVVIPKLEELQREGEQGKKKITQYTRYTTVGLALLQSTGLVTLARSGAAFGTNVMPQRRHGHHPADGADADRGYHRDHVARGADLATGRRQRHVAADLRVDHQPVPLRVAARANLQRVGVGRRRRADGRLPLRRRRVHRARAATDPGAVRPASDRPPLLRRSVHLHPPQAQPGWCDPGHLRVLAAVPAGIGGDRSRAAPGSRPSSRPTSRTRPPGSSSPRSVS
jgi:hypothetical protein